MTRVVLPTQPCSHLCVPSPLGCSSHYSPSESALNHKQEELKEQVHHTSTSAGTDTNTDTSSSSSNPLDRNIAQKMTQERKQYPVQMVPVVDGNCRTYDNRTNEDRISVSIPNPIPMPVSVPTTVASPTLTTCEENLNDFFDDDFLSLMHDYDDNINFKMDENINTHVNENWNNDITSVQNTKREKDCTRVATISSSSCCSNNATTTPATVTVTTNTPLSVPSSSFPIVQPITDVNNGNYMMQDAQATPCPQVSNAFTDPSTPAAITATALSKTRTKTSSSSCTNPILKPTHSTSTLGQKMKKSTIGVPLKQRSENKKKLDTTSCGMKRGRNDTKITDDKEEKTTDEEMKKNGRRERNREHAKRSRKRKKAFIETLQQTILQLQNENNKLRSSMSQHFGDTYVENVLSSSSPVSLPASPSSTQPVPPSVPTSVPMSANTMTGINNSTGTLFAPKAMPTVYTTTNGLNPQPACCSKANSSIIDKKFSINSIGIKNHPPIRNDKKLYNCVVSASSLSSTTTLKGEIRNHHQQQSQQNQLFTTPSEPSLTVPTQPSADVATITTTTCGSHINNFVANPILSLD